MNCTPALPVAPGDALVQVLGSVTLGRRAHTLLALVRHGAGVRRAYVKAFPAAAPRGLVNEVVGWTIGRHVGLAQPPAMLLPVARAHFGAAGDDLPAGDPLWCFASLEAHEPADARQGCAKILYNVANPGDYAALADDLKRWPGLPLAIAFDQWLANVDRNLGNLVRTGEGRWALIDHSDLLTGCAWTADDLVAEQWALNKLVDMLLPAAGLALPIKSAIVEAAGQFSAGYAKACAELYHWLAGTTGSAELRAHYFVWKRAPLTRELLRQRLRLIV